MNDHQQRRYSRLQRWFSAGWLVHLWYGLRGRIDGRRGMPLVTEDTAVPSPTLHRLADEVVREFETARALGQEWTSAERIELAQLTAGGGRQARAAQRLATMRERLAEIEAAGPQSGRRFGEDHLPDELVESRRQREHTRRVRQARKRVEDERTALSELLTAQSRLEATIEVRLERAESQARAVGEVRRSHATAYLNGALREHPERPLLSAKAALLMPWAPSSTDNDLSINQREDLS